MPGLTPVPLMLRSSCQVMSEREIVRLFYEPVLETIDGAPVSIFDITKVDQVPAGTYCAEVRTHGFDRRHHLYGSVHITGEGARWLERTGRFYSHFFPAFAPALTNLRRNREFRAADSVCMTDGTDRAVLETNEQLRKRYALSVSTDVLTRLLDPIVEIYTSARDERLEQLASH